MGNKPHLPAAFRRAAEPFSRQLIVSHCTT